MEPEWNSSPESDDASLLGLRNAVAYISTNQLECGKLCKIAHDLLQKSNLNLQDAILCLEVKSSINYEETAKCIT
jgi:hypothetical protein